MLTRRRPIDARWATTHHWHALVAEVMAATYSHSPDTSGVHRREPERRLTRSPFVAGQASFVHLRSCTDECNLVTLILRAQRTTTWYAAIVVMSSAPTMTTMRGLPGARPKKEGRHLQAQHLPKLQPVSTSARARPPQNCRAGRRACAAHLALYHVLSVLASTLSSTRKLPGMGASMQPLTIASASCALGSGPSRMSSSCTCSTIFQPSCRRRG